MRDGDPMHYVVYGAGAIGSAIGARLTEHGYDVTLIARGAHLEAMQSNGVRIRTPYEDVRIPVTTVAHPSEVAWRGDEVVLLTMKSQHTTEAVETLRAVRGSGVSVVCAQNAVENERIAARRFAQVYSMLIQMPATYLDPGEVLTLGSEVTGVLPAGCFPSGVDETIEKVCAALASSGFRSWPEPEMSVLKYGKLLYVNLENAAEAVCGTNQEIEPLVEMLVDEGRRVLDAAGITYPTREAFWARVVMPRGEVPGYDLTAGGSTWQSLARGAGSIETDYLNGEIILLGTLHGVPTPVNRILQDRVTHMLDSGEPAGSVLADEILRLARHPRSSS